LDSIQLQTSALQKTSRRKLETEPQVGRKYSDSIKDQYLKYSTIRKQMPQLKKGKNLKDILPKKTYTDAE
jgi:hypothetical protein